MRNIEPIYSVAIGAIFCAIVLVTQLLPVYAGIPLRPDYRVFARGMDNALWQKTWEIGTGFSPWTKVGGLLTSDPDAGTMSGNRLDVVARGNDNAVWQKTWQTGTGWSPWKKVGGVINGGPTVTSIEDDKLDIFARGMDNALWQKTWQTGTGWSPWTKVGGVLTSDPDAASFSSQGFIPSSALIEVVARGNNGAPWEKAWWMGTWESWQSLSGSIIGGPTVTLEP